MNWFRSKNYPIWLLVIYFIFWSITAIKPNYPKEFVLENILSMILVAVIISTYKKFRLSNLSYTLLFVYMTLNAAGAHYTYAEVPYNEWSKMIFGVSINEIFGFTRNHYDRLVHLMFGLLIYYPIREIFLRIASVKGFWGYYLPLDVVISFSALYEMIEWGIALIFGGDLGQLYLGTQGDVWDAQKDMAFAASGAFISMIIVAVINYIYRKNFAKELGDSLTVKRKMPLGENALRRLMRRFKREIR